MLNDMDCKDLMVGDWVICNHYQDKPFTKQFGVADFAKGDYEFCEPIPLTEEILVKNGFEKTTNDWNRHGRPLIIFESMGFPTISIHADMDMKHFWVHGTIDLTYVHQLQHLLRLCGIEKELTI